MSPVPPDRYHASERSVAAARRFLRATAAAARGGTRTPLGLLGENETGSAMPSLAECVESFVPTMVRLRAVGRESGLKLSRDLDHAHRPRFVTSLHVERRRRGIEAGRVVCLAVWAHLAPPALPAEANRRARLLRATGRGVPRIPLGRSLPGAPFEALTHRENRRTRFLTLDDMVAVGTILVARDGLLAAYSGDGSWPRNPLVLEVARRRGCRIVRFGLDVVPRPLLRRLAVQRYEKVSRAAYAGDDA